MNWNRKMSGGVMAFIGFMLSPLSWWNDLFVNVPLAVGFGSDASSRRPLGLVIVGGLVLSQMVTLYITPVIYLWLEYFQEHVLDRVPFLRRGHARQEPEPAADVSEPAPSIS